MQRKNNTPNYSYLVQVSGWASGRVEYQRIDQAITGRPSRRDIERLTEQVRHHLRQMTAKTGLVYQVIGQGPSHEVTATIERCKVTVS